MTNLKGRSKLADGPGARLIINDGTDVAIDEQCGSQLHDYIRHLTIF